MPIRFLSEDLWFHTRAITMWVQKGKRTVEMRDCEINPTAFIKLHVPRMHKIFGRHPLSDFWPPFSLYPRRAVALLKLARTRQHFVISVFSLLTSPSDTTKLFPTRNLPTTMRPAMGFACSTSHARCLFPYRSLFLKPNSRFFHINPSHPSPY